MSLFTLRLTTADGVEEFPMAVGDLMRFERAYPSVDWQAFAAGTAQPRLEWVLFLAHRSAVRRGLTTLDLDDWADTIEGIPTEDEAAVAVPLDRPAGGSPGSLRSVASRPAS